MKTKYNLFTCYIWMYFFFWLTVSYIYSTLLTLFSPFSLLFRFDETASFLGLNVLVVGAKASGTDLTHQISKYAKNIYVSKYKAKESVHRVYGKHCSWHFYSSSLSFKPVPLSLSRISSILKHPNKFFF